MVSRASSLRVYVGLHTSLTSLPSWSVICEAQHRIAIRQCHGLIVESLDRTSSSSPPRTSSYKGGGWSLCAMWRSSSSSSLTEHRHRISLLQPTSLSVVYVKRWCKWTLLSYSSHPPLHVEPTLVPVDDREHHSSERAPPHATLRHRVPISRQVGPCWAVRTEQASRAVSRAGRHAGPRPEIRCG
jgi:hypothetical protein